MHYPTCIVGQGWKATRVILRDAHEEALIIQYKSLASIGITHNANQRDGIEGARGRIDL